MNSFIKYSSVLLFCWSSQLLVAQVSSTNSGSLSSASSGFQNGNLIENLVDNASYTASAAAKGTDFMEMVMVDDTDNQGNPGEHDLNGYPLGAVPYRYEIGKYDVTANQYCAFLNAVATSDPYGLYDPRMGGDVSDPNAASSTLQPGTAPQAQSSTNSAAGDPLVACIQRSGTDGNYVYNVIKNPDGTDRGQLPVTYVMFFNALRFCNWMENGQPTGPEGPLTTESGSYDIGNGTQQKSNATWVLPSQSEWYKAAYYHRNSGTNNMYWSYATQSNIAPGNSLVNAMMANQANYALNGVFTMSSAPYLTPVGTFEASPGPYGTFDMGGDVRQWLFAFDPTSGYVIAAGGSWASQDLSITYDNTPDPVDPLGSGKTLGGNTVNINTIGFRLVHEIPGQQPSKLSQAYQELKVDPTTGFYSAMNGWFGFAMAGALKSVLVPVITPEQRQVIALSTENAANREGMNNLIARSNLQDQIISGYARQRAGNALTKGEMENIDAHISTLADQPIPEIAPEADLAAAAAAEETFALCSAPMFGALAVPVIIGVGAYVAYNYFSDPINGVGVGAALAGHALSDAWDACKYVGRALEWL